MAEKVVGSALFQSGALTLRGDTAGILANTVSNINVVLDPTK